MLRIALAALLCGAALHAQEDLDALLGGFDDVESVDTSTLEAPEAQPAEPSRLAAYGSVGFSTSYNYAHKAPQAGRTDHRGFSRARAKAEMSIDGDLPGSWRSKVELKLFYDALYALKGRDEYTDDMLDTYEDEAEIKEAYVQGSLAKSLDLKIGRQIVVWGKSDNIRLTDILNPLDNREPGMVDIEDLRLPVVMSKLDYYAGSWNFSVMVIHENRLPKEAAEGSDFLPVHIFPLPGGVFPEVEDPESGIDDTRFAASLNGRFTGWDLSLYAARVLDSRWHLTATPSGDFVRRYSPVSMAGLAANVALGNWLLKTEVAHFSELRYRHATDEKKRLDVLIGTEYSGVTNTTLSLEIANRHLGEYDDALLQAPDFTYEDEQQLALRASRTFDREKGTASLLFSGFYSEGEQLGGFLRVRSDYELSDAWKASIGVIDYLGGEKPMFEAMKRNDRVFAEAVYSFGL